MDLFWEVFRLDRDEWILEELQQIYDKSHNYNHLTLIKATQDLIKEQRKRRLQMEGELEGTIWSPRRWGE